jgi:hypothetical protein
MSRQRKKHPILVAQRENDNLFVRDSERKGTRPKNAGQMQTSNKTRSCRNDARFRKRGRRNQAGAIPRNGSRV